MRLSRATLLIGAMTMALLIRQSPDNRITVEERIHTPGDRVREDAEDLRVQARCADQARQTYLDLGYPKGLVSGYATYHNAGLNRCFLHVANSERNSLSGATWTFRRLLDASHRTDFGVF